MNVYTVRILDTVFADIGDIADYIVAVSTPEHAAKYARELQAEIMSLSYLAGIIPESRYLSVRHYHPHAKQLRTHNKQLNIIFHIDDDYVVVDRIIHSSRIAF